MKDYVTSLGALILAAIVYFESSSFVVEGGGLAQNPAFYPRVLAALLIILAVMLLVSTLIKKEKLKFFVNKDLLLNVGKVFGLIFLYVLAFQYVGFIVSTVAFIVAGILLYGGNIKSALLCGIPVTAVVYIVFHVLMRVPMLQGILF